MWGGVLEPALEEAESVEVARNDREFDWEGSDAPAGGAIPVVVTAAKKEPVDNPKEDPEDDPVDAPAADEELEELEGDELEADSEDDDFPEVDDDLIDLDDEWDEQTEEERHDNPHKFFE